MVEYIPSYGAPAVHWSLLPGTRLASRKILIEENIKSGQGQHSVYLASLGVLPKNVQYVHKNYNYQKLLPTPRPLHISSLKGLLRS